MILNIAEAIKAPGEQFPFKMEGRLEELSRGFDRFKILSPLFIEGTYMALGESIFVEGRLKIQLETICHRCLDPFIFEKKVKFREEFVKHLDPDSDGFLYSGDEIDLTDMAEQDLILSLPMRLLCREDCRGLCPTCSHNLNRGSCGCQPLEEEAQPNPFAQLKQMFSKEVD